MNKELLNTLSRIKMVIFDFDGVFTNNTVLVSQDGYEAVQCWRSDGLGLARLKQINIPTMILSSEKNPVVSVRAAKLQINCLQGIEKKDDAIFNICSEYGLKTSEIVYVGNDINDIPAFKIVGLPIAVHDAYPEVLPYVSFVTQRSGGMGAVREVCDLIYSAITALSKQMDYA